jgi:hypothetical protein
MKRGRFCEEQIVGILKEHEAGRKDCGAVSGAWRQRADAVRLEKQVRRDGGWRSATAEKSGRREPPVEATGGGSESDKEALKAIVRKNGWSLPA